MSASGPEVFGQPLSAKPTYNVRHDPGSRHPARLFRLKHNHPAPPRDGIWIKCSMVFSGGCGGHSPDRRRHAGQRETDSGDL